MTPHRALMDDLEARLRSPDLPRIAGALPDIRVVRDGPDRLTIHEGASEDWLVEVTPLASGEAPDAKPRLSLRSAKDLPLYADHSVDGLVMSLFGMLLAARAGAA